MLEGEIYLIEYHAFIYSGVDFCPSYDLIRKVDKNLVILASTERKFIGRTGVSVIHAGEELFNCIESIKHVTSDDLPLYIGWPYTNPELATLIKRYEMTP